MPFPKMLPQPRMLLQKFIGGNSFKQLECFANTHGGRHFNEEVDMIDGDMHFVNTESVFVGNFADEPFTVNPYAIESHGVFGILGFPDKVKGILPESVLKASQIHFFTPPNQVRKFQTQLGKFNSKEKLSDLFMHHHLLNLRTAIPRSASKAEVSLP